MLGMPALFDLSERYAALSAARDPLERLSSDIELFRGPLVKSCGEAPAAQGGGRPPFVSVMMFKSLVLQALSSLYDEATEFPFKSRLSF